MLKRLAIGSGLVLVLAVGARAEEAPAPNTAPAPVVQVTPSPAPDLPPPNKLKELLDSANGAAPAPRTAPIVNRVPTSSPMTSPILPPDDDEAPSPSHEATKLVKPPTELKDF